MYGHLSSQLPDKVPLLHNRICQLLLLLLHGFELPLRPIQPVLHAGRTTLPLPVVIRQLHAEKESLHHRVNRLAAPPPCMWRLRAHAQRHLLAHPI